jgi:hypothetical protein
MIGISQAHGIAELGEGVVGIVAEVYPKLQGTDLVRM